MRILKHQPFFLRQELSSLILFDNYNQWLDKLHQGLHPHAAPGNEEWKRWCSRRATVNSQTEASVVEQSGVLQLHRQSFIFHSSSEAQKKNSYTCHYYFIPDLQLRPSVASRLRRMRWPPWLSLWALVFRFPSFPGLYLEILLLLEFLFLQSNFWVEPNDVKIIRLVHFTDFPPSAITARRPENFHSVVTVVQNVLSNRKNELRYRSKQWLSYLTYSQTYAFVWVQYYSRCTIWSQSNLQPQYIWRGLVLPI